MAAGQLLQLCCYKECPDQGISWEFGGTWMGNLFKLEEQLIIMIELFIRWLNTVENSTKTPLLFRGNIEYTGTLQG